MYSHRDLFLASPLPFILLSRSTAMTHECILHAISNCLPPFISQPYYTWSHESEENPGGSTYRISPASRSQRSFRDSAAPDSGGGSRYAKGHRRTGSNDSSVSFRRSSVKEQPPRYKDRNSSRNGESFSRTGRASQRDFDNPERAPHNRAGDKRSLQLGRILCLSLSRCVDPHPTFPLAISYRQRLGRRGQALS